MATRALVVGLSLAVLHAHAMRAPGQRYGVLSECTDSQPLSQPKHSLVQALEQALAGGPRVGIVAPEHDRRRCAVAPRDL